jgi:hypothetical protein
MSAMLEDVNRTGTLDNQCERKEEAKRVARPGGAAWIFFSRSIVPAFSRPKDLF